MSSNTDKSGKSTSRKLFRRAVNKLEYATRLTTRRGGSTRNKDTKQGPQIDTTRGVFILTTTMPSMDVNTAASLNTCRYTLVQPSGGKDTADQDWIETIDSPQELSTLWDRIKTSSEPAEPKDKSFQKAMGRLFGVDLDGEDYNGSLKVDIFESSSAANHSEPGVIVAGDGTISQDTNEPYGEECDDSVFGRAVCHPRHRDALMSAEGLSGNVRNEVKSGKRGNITFNFHHQIRLCQDNHFSLFAAFDVTSDASGALFDASGALFDASGDLETHPDSIPTNLRPLTASAYQSALASLQSMELIKTELAKVKEDQEKNLGALHSDGADSSQPIDAIDADVAPSNTTATIIPTSAEDCLVSSTDAQVIASYTYTPKLAKYDWSDYF